MSNQRRLLLVMVIPAIVLVAAAYVFFQQSLSASRAVGDLDAAEEEISRLESENADLAAAQDQLGRDLAFWQDLGVSQDEELQACKGEVARLQSQIVSTGPWAAALGQVDPLEDCITVVNRSSVLLSLAEWSVSDGEGSYTFPPEAVVEPFGSLQVCIDTYNPDREPQRLFLLSDGDEVYLRDPDGELADQASW